MTAVKVRTSTGWVTLTGGGVPLPVTNGQFIKGVSGAAVWAPISNSDLPVMTDANLPARIQSQASAISDCNAVTGSGWYACNGASNGPPAPANGWGYLLVLDSFGGSNYRTQLYFQIDQSVIFARAQYNAAWTTWAQINPAVVNDSALRPSIRDQINFGLGDVNLAISNGWYIFSRSNSNVPTATTEWFVFVISYNSNYQKQIAYDVYSSARWQRYCANGTWNAWEQDWPFSAIAENILPGRLQQVTVSVPSNDCNLATANGWYFTQPSTANAPPGGSYYGLQVINVTASSQVRQIAYDYQTDNIYERRLTAGQGWQPWKQIFPDTYNSAPPANPTDGQIWTLIDSGANPTYQWRFRYNAGSSSAYKWEFIGGAPKAIPFSYGGALAGLWSSGGWMYYADARGQFAIPRAGDYNIFATFEMAGGSSMSGWNQVSLSIMNLTTPTTFSRTDMHVYTNLRFQGSTGGRANGIAAGQNVGPAGSGADLGNTFWNRCDWTVVPIRVS